MFTISNSLSNINKDIQSKSQMLFNNKDDTNRNVNNQNNNRFVGRSGDWICIKCHNLNFSFRTNCNRCHLTKSENHKMMYQQKYVRNLLYGFQNP